MKKLEGYTRSDATQVRDYLFAKGLNGASVARIFGTVRAVINLALSEFSLSIINPFSNVYFNRSAGVTKRLPVQPEDIKKAQEQMMLIQLQVQVCPDQISHLAGLIRIQIGRFELVIECGRMLKDLVDSVPPWLD